MRWERTPLHEASLRVQSLALNVKEIVKAMEKPWPPIKEDESPLIELCSDGSIIEALRHVEWKCGSEGRRGLSLQSRGDDRSGGCVAPPVSLIAEAQGGYAPRRGRP